MGADPVSWLLGSAIGLSCLAGGVVLTGAGIIWTGRIASAVERQL
jgi:tight adherence protein B